MHKSLKALLTSLLNKRCIGAKHTPEDLLIKAKTHWISPKEKRDFDKEYKEIINEGLIMRLKKKTGKGSGWHISLNPRRLKEIYEKVF